MPIVVDDAFGRDLSGATVTVADPCPNKPASVTTDAAGTALVSVLGDTLFAETDVTSEKTDYVTRTQSVRVELDPTASAASDSSSSGASLRIYTGNTFRLLYRAYGSLAEDAIKPGDTISISASSVAPPLTAPSEPRSQMIARLPDGSRLDLTQGTTVGDTTAWSGSFVVPLGTHDELYVVNVCVVADACAGSCWPGVAPPSVASEVTRLLYHVDTAPPRIDDLNVFPTDGANSVYPDGPVVLHVYDTGGSGVEPGSLQVQVLDSAGVVFHSFGPSELSYDEGTGRVQSSAMSLVIGNVYRITASAQDRAGNQLTYQGASLADKGGFLVTSATYGSSSSSIAPTPCALSSSPNPAFKTATCNNVPLSFTAASVTVGGSRYAGTGVVGKRVTLENARITTVTGGLPVTSNAYNASDPAWAPREADLIFDLTESAGTQTVSASGTTLNIGTLQVEVPATATSATLDMLARPTSTLLRTCAVMQPYECGPDPIRPPPWESSYIGATLTGAETVGGAPSTTVTASQVTYDASGQLLEEEPFDYTFQEDGGPAQKSEKCVPTRDDGSGAAVPDYQSLKRMTIEGKEGGSGAEIIYQNLVTAWKDAYQRDGRTWAVWESCIHGGADARKGRVLTMTGTAMSARETGDHMILHDWPVENGEPMVGSSISFQVKIGPITIGTSANQVPDGENWGTTGNGGPVDSPYKDDYWNNTVNAWWYAGRYNPIIGGHPGSHGYQAATLQGAWDYDMSGDTTFRWGWKVQADTVCYDILGLCQWTDWRP